MKRLMLAALLAVFAVACGSSVDVGAEPELKLIQGLESRTPTGCTPRDKERHVYKNNRAFAQKWIDCGKSSAGRSARTAACLLEAYPDLSNKCAACLGDYVGCSSAGCWLPCAFAPDGESCKTCSINKCQPALMTCGGLAESDIPRRD